MVVFDLGRRPLAQGELFDSLRVGRVADVEERDLGPLDLAGVAGVLADAEK